jgi:hypothetical protein
MGKYSGLKKSFVKFTGEPEYQDKVNDEKETVKEWLRLQGKKGTIRDFADVMLKARVEKAALEKEVKTRNLTIAAMDQILVELLEDQTLNKIQMDQGVSMSIKDDIYCTVKDKPTFLRWISETDQEDLLTVNYQTMSSITKKRITGEIGISEGEETIPPGIDVYFKQSIMVRGAKNLGIVED